LKDEGAIDWREGFRNFHWTRETSSRKGHRNLPKEKEYLVWEEEERKRMNV